MNCLGNIYSWVLGGPTIGPDSMFKLILSGSQDLTIGIQIGPVGKNTLGGYIEDMMKRGCGGELQESFYEESHLH